jgi:hypothetical protein
MALSGLLLFATRSLSAAPNGPESANQGANNSDASAEDCDLSMSGSPYIPVDSWIYPAVLRLYSLGFLDHVFLGLRPWTRASLSHMLEDTPAKIADATKGPVTDEARELDDALHHELHLDSGGPCKARTGDVRIESTYSVVRAISGTPLRDSFHLGSTIVNDYGRPFENGFNNYSGLSGYATAGRLTLYVRGEFQGAPSATGYSAALAQTLSGIDETSYFVPSSTAPYGPTTAVFNQTTIPQGPIATATQGRFLEAYVSAQFLNHVFSFGKQDEWMGPAQGASMAYSNNAENIYAFHINRSEPLYIPLLSRLTGPFRYEFLASALRGHTLMPNPLCDNNPSPCNNNAPSQPNVINPGDPWVHAEKFSFKPTRDLEFGFERTVIWGGEGHEPITVHTFLRSFFSTNATDPTEKYSNRDPGARFGTFDFVYRLPLPGHWLTLYSDMEAHDTPSPIAKPLHGTFRPGLYLSHVPGIPKLDMRVEAADTDSSYPESIGGRYQYWESIQRQGYTNQGQLFGDWMGREDKGGQGWITYHLSGNEWVQASVRSQKASKDFIPGGTTLDDCSVQAVKRIRRGFEIDGSFTLEHWKAPVYLPGLQTVTSTAIQLTWFPERKIGF